MIFFQKLDIYCVIKFIEKLTLWVSRNKKQRQTDKKERNKQTNKKSKAFNVVGRNLNDFSVVDTSSALRGKK
jgi:hypothetical protein